MPGGGRGNFLQGSDTVYISTYQSHSRKGLIGRSLANKNWIPFFLREKNMKLGTYIIKWGESRRRWGWEIIFIMYCMKFNDVLTTSVGIFW